VKSLWCLGAAVIEFVYFSLKNLQAELGQSEELHQVKLQTLKENRKKCEKLEEQAQHFREREALAKKIKLLEQRRDWSLVAEQKKVWVVRNSFSG
jgi:hypothetical protein